MYRFTIGWLVLNVLAVAVLADERDNVKSSAGVLTATILRAKFDRVGVLPVLFEEDQPNQFLNNGPKAPVLRGTIQSQLYAEMMEEQLAEKSGGAFRVIDGERIFQALKKQVPDTSKLKSNSPAFQQLAMAVEGLQGLVVGTVRERHTEDDLNYAVRDLAWKLIDLKDGSIVAGNSKSTYFSLADAVYQGRSQEYFRWVNGRLFAIGFSYSIPPLAEMPLKPDDPLDLYGLVPYSTGQPHPIVNSKCPFKVSFEVNGRPRNIHVPVAKEIGNVSPFGEGPETGQRILDGSAYLPLDPGDSLGILVRNRSPQNALVAVFVDGINILGKKRELPDDKCRVWGLNAGQAGNFKGWYSGPKGMEKLEEFVVTPWADSVAGQMGEKDQLGAITLVFFNAGWPSRNVLAKHPRPYGFSGWWDSQQNKFAVAEAIQPDRGPTAMGFAIGAKKPQPKPLDYQKVEPQGTILCSMTIWYGPKGELHEIAKVREVRSSYVDAENFVLVEGRTNGQE